MSQIHRSSASQLSSFNNYVDELSDAELIKLVTDTKSQMRILRLENEIFENTIMRLDPTLMHGVQQAMDYAAKMHATPGLGAGSFIKSQTSRFAFDSLQSPSRMLHSPSRISTKKAESSARIGGTIIFGSGPRINVLEKSELVAAEVEILIKTLEKARFQAAKKHSLLKAQLEEISVRVTDAKKDSERFKQIVIVEGWDKIAQRIPAEIWVRFMSEWLKITDNQIGKLRLRTSTLNTQYSKFKGQIRVKAELSESLRPVDFEKLKIENDECFKIIERKLVQLEELKKLTGDANLNLTIHKKLMIEQNNYLANVLKNIEAKKKQTIELDKEMIKIQAQGDALHQKLDEVKKVRNAYEVPDVMDYVGVKAELADLQHSVKVLKNRCHIQFIALASQNKKLQSMTKFH